jgi:hypothetical protein
MALRCVRVATFTLLLISFALLMRQPTADAQTPTPTNTARPTRTPITSEQNTPKPGHGPLSLSPHSAPVADCIGKCRQLYKGSSGDFLVCVASCTTRKPTATERPTRTPGGEGPACCQCPPISGDTSPFCVGGQSIEDCEIQGCVPKVGFVCPGGGGPGHCVSPPPPTPTATPPIPICCQCGFTNLPSCFDTVLPEPCSPVGCVAIVGSFCGLDGRCAPF